ncbi:creatininase family protein [Endozoicomonas sp. G2_1]|uniref:creatininase family protein n=1 Tax=Endozoicomonas sp. G2_1 TaxID=2821091 RepID=UPI001ADB8994|nr:creatininase family protein [Endozoicomonas sp. G2_1]MBO9490309.1 creatininase family protein [Endozoicomonas sp. G2_1]
MKKIFSVIVLLIASTHWQVMAAQSKNPISPYDTVFIEEMTWLEVRDAIKAGKTTAIIATGGVEQNGPYLATGKHNVILKLTTDKIARQLGNALVAPIVAFVPEGDKKPPTKHMRYPGTISLTEKTFMLLLTEIAESLKVHGFTEIVLLGDSGGNQSGMNKLAKSLNKAWQKDKARVHFVPEYYDNPRWTKWLQARGINEVKDGEHHDFRHTALMMLADPMSVRMPQRIATGDFSVNGIDLMPMSKTLSLAKELLRYQTDITVAAINQRVNAKP